MTKQAHENSGVEPNGPDAIAPNFWSYRLLSFNLDGPHDAELLLAFSVLFSK